MRQEDFNRRFLQLLFLFAVGVCIYYYVKSQLSRRRRDDMPWFAAALAIALRWSPGASRAADNRFKSLFEHLNGDSVESLARQDRGRCRPGRGAAAPRAGARSARNNAGRGRRTVGLSLSDAKQPSGSPSKHGSDGPGTAPVGIGSGSVAAVGRAEAAPAQAGALDFLEGLSSSSEQSDLESLGSVASGGEANRAQACAAGSSGSTCAAGSSQARVVHDLRPGVPTAAGDGEALAALSETMLGISVWDIISKRNKMRVSGLLQCHGDDSCEALGFTVHRLNQHTLQIMYLGVAQTARRGGIGRTLVRTVREVARREPLCLSIVVLLSAYEEGSPLTDMASPSVTAFLRATGFRRTEMKGLEDGQVCFKIEVRKMSKKQKRHMEQTGNRFSGGGTTLEWSEVLAEAKRSAGASRSAKAVAGLRLPPPVRRETPQADEQVAEPLESPRLLELVAPGAQEEEEDNPEEFADGAYAALDPEDEEDGEDDIVEQLTVSKLADSGSRPNAEEPVVTSSWEEGVVEQPLQPLPRLQVPVDLEDEWEDDDGSKEIKISRWDQSTAGSTRESEVARQTGSKSKGRTNRWAPVLPLQTALPQAGLEMTEPQAVVQATESMAPSQATPAPELEVVAEHCQEVAGVFPHAVGCDATTMGESLGKEAQDEHIAPLRKRPVALKRPHDAAKIMWRPTLRHMQPAESLRPQGR